MTDELDRIRDLRPSVPGPSRELVNTERNRLMSVIEREVHAEPEHPERRRKPWVRSGLAVAALAATAAAGYALTRDVGTTTEVSCPGGIVDSVTGDPVADCAELWRQQNGTEPPALTAYDNQTGGIEVVAADAPVPADWVPLDAGFSQDPRLVELDAALADHGDGLNARCYEPDEGRPVAEAALDRLGLDDWSVRIDEDRPDGDGMCTVHLLDPDAGEVVLFPLHGGLPPEDTPSRRLARSVQQQVDARCLTRDEAVEAVRQAATDLDISEASGELVVNAVTDPSAECSRTDVNVGGRIEVTVRGA